MSREGVDFSMARPSPAALVKAGKSFVVRYCPYQIRVRLADGSTALRWVAKGLTAAEVVAYREAGLAIVFNFESIAGRMKQGGSPVVSRANGIADAKLVEAAIARLDLPRATVCYFSADWDARESEQVLIDAYLKGAASVLGPERVGVYAGYYVVLRCRANGTARWFWQTYAWSGGHLFSYAHLYQYNNGENIDGAVDLDRALKDDFGQWEAPLDLYSTPGRKTASVVAGTAHFDAPNGRQTGNVDSGTARFDIIAQDKAESPGWVVIDGASADGAKYPNGVLSRWVRASALRNVRNLVDELVPPPPPPPDPVVLTAEAERQAFNAGVDAAAASAATAAKP